MALQQPEKPTIPARLPPAPRVTPVTPAAATPRSDDILWADKKIATYGEGKLIEAPGKGKRIVVYFYRKGNMGDGEAKVGFKWQDAKEIFWESRMWYCGVELADISKGRKGPENKALIVNVEHETGAARRVDISVGYKVESV